MADGTRRTLSEWREARKMSHEAVMRARSGVNAGGLKEWDRTGYPTRQGGRSISPTPTMHRWN